MCVKAIGASQGHSEKSRARGRASVYLGTLGTSIVWGCNQQSSLLACPVCYSLKAPHRAGLFLCLRVFIAFVLCISVRAVYVCDLCTCTLVDGHIQGHAWRPEEAPAPSGSTYETAGIVRWSGTIKPQ